MKVTVSVRAQILLTLYQISVYLAVVIVKHVLLYLYVHHVSILFIYCQMVLVWAVVLLAVMQLTVGAKHVLRIAHLACTGQVSLL